MVSIHKVLINMKASFDGKTVIVTHGFGIARMTFILIAFGLHQRVLSEDVRQLVS